MRVKLLWELHMFPIFRYGVSGPARKPSRHGRQISNDRPIARLGSMTLNYRNRDLDAVGRSKIDGIVHAHSGRRQPAQISTSLHPPS